MTYPHPMDDKTGFDATDEEMGLAAKTTPNFAKQSPREKREDKARKYDFNCRCGEQWDTPGHIFWVSRMYCSCGEVVESE